jgi:ribosome maturation factor RimP
MPADLRERLLVLAEPLIGQLGYELVDLEFVPGRAHGLLRLFIDRSEGVTVDDCERVSHEMSALLDVEDPIPTAYSLEVSSPGLDRLLRIPAHYARFKGARVAVELTRARGDRRRYTGAMTEVKEKGIDLDVDGQTVEITFAEISKARLVPEWPDKKPRRR